MAAARLASEAEEEPLSYNGVVFFEHAPVGRFGADSQGNSKLQRPVALNLPKTQKTTYQTTK